MSTDIIVMHAQEPTFGRGSHPAYPEGYRIVAVVTHDAPENLTDEQLAAFAFMETNHIDTTWWENDSVTLQEKSRSTSVGDVVSVRGRVLRCMNAGWALVEPATRRAEQEAA